LVGLKRIAASSRCSLARNYRGYAAGYDIEEDVEEDVEEDYAAAICPRSSVPQRPSPEE
jgi:hypothetical protein